MKKLVLWAILFISTASFAENETSVRLYRPFTAGVQQPGIQVAKVLTGYCDMQSEVMPREDAWRCTNDSQTFDPCFIKPGKDKTHLYCPETPWTESTIQINTKQQVSNDGFRPIDMAKGKPWAIEMQGGQHCLAVEESEYIDHQPVSYVCQGGEYLLGQLQRCKSAWSVLWSNGSMIEERKINEVWF